MSGLDWSRPLRTKGGKAAMLLPPAATTDRRRVGIQRNGKGFESFGESRDATVWLYEEDGTLARADGSWTLENES